MYNPPSTIWQRNMVPLSKTCETVETFQQRHHRSILSIKWNHFVSAEEVLERANFLDIEIKHLKNRLRCTLDVSYLSYERYLTSESTAIWQVGRF